MIKTLLVFRMLKRLVAIAVTCAVVRASANFLMPVASEGLIEQRASAQVASNVLLDVSQRRRAADYLVRQTAEAIAACSEIMHRKLFFSDIGYEYRHDRMRTSAESGASLGLPLTMMQPYLINLEAHDEALSLLAKKVSCTYDPATRSATGMT